jgi:UDP-glucose 4-epimerase
MTVLVTGGSGFIGRHVVDTLRSRGENVLTFDRTRHGSGYDAIFGDIRDATQVTEAAAHADSIIHLAGVLGTQETIANPRPAAETNVLGGLNVLEAATQYDLPLVYIAVGNHWMDNPYSITKTATERLCKMYRTERGLTVATVRAMNAYGPGQVPARPYGPSKVRKIMPALICRALKGMPLEVYGDGTQQMDMVYVTDVTETLIGALGHNQDYEVGTGLPTTVTEIAETVLSEVGEGTIDFLPMRPGEPEHSSVVANAERMLYPARVTLEDGVRDTVEWFRTRW